MRTDDLGLRHIEDGLSIGDVVRIPAGRRAGLAVILDPGTSPIADARPMVLTEDRWAGRVSMLDFPTAAKVLGLFPVNLLHNIVHLVFGIWGLAASRSWGGSKQFFVWGGTIYLILTIGGFLSPAGFGVLPLGGSDIGLHCVLAIVMLLIGVTAKPVASAATV